MTAAQNTRTPATERLHMISLKKMCQQIGAPELFPSIRNRIGLLCREHSDLWTHLYINRKDTADVYLTANGVQAFGGILADYFGEKEIQLLQRDLR